MTEELKQKAEKSAEKFFGKPTDLVDLDNLRIFKNGYLTGVEEVKADCDFALEGKDVEIKELKDKLNNWVKCAELRLANWQKYETENNHLLDVINNQAIKIADLEKKVKEIEHNKKTVVHLSECISDIQDKQIEQSKKIIEKLCNAVRTLNNPNTELTDVDDFLSEAEQFIKEE
ncbi:MAG: hypothetical protein IKS48_00325 [Eubacterium sp.]|nr:hypothetical protein [Eubacterium sp.]